MTYPEFFAQLTQALPYPFQERLAQLLLDGRSVVLRAPTGAGKTWAAVAPFLYSLASNRRVADRLLYALPLRSLASSLHDAVQDGMERVFPIVRVCAKDRDYPSSAPYCCLQMGGRKNDPFFESDITFTTIDQLLSSYLMLPVSLPDRLGNINAGALLGSLLVFDELHLLDVNAALGTAIEMLDRLRGLSQFVLMTATLSDSGVEWLAKKLGAVPFLLTGDEIRALPTHSTKQRLWRWADTPLDAAAVLQSHQGGRTIALVNTVARAQGLFRELDARLHERPTTCLLLHSRFYPEDRASVEAQLPAFFGPKADHADVVLVTTQVIEAGLDLSADNLHTEIAPMNALVQRAGRVARYPQRNAGAVTVHSCERLGPYTEKKTEVAATEQHLRALPPEGAAIDFSLEQEWIDAVHSAGETRSLSAYNSLAERRRSVHEAMEGDCGKLSSLVRDSDSLNVLIAAQPEKVNFSGPTWPRLLSVPRISLFRLAATGAMKGAVPDADGFQWNPIKSPTQAWLVAIHPDAASYDSRLGLLLGEPGPEPEIRYLEPAPRPRYQYKFEPWTDHVTRIRAQARQIGDAYSIAVQKLVDVGLFPGTLPEPVDAAFVELLVELVCTLHDVGKLTEAWQKAAWDWQSRRDPKPWALLAHTTFDPKVDQKVTMPPHAVEGAFAVEEAIHEWLAARLGQDCVEPATKAAVSAIARHHGPRSKQVGAFRLNPQAEDAVRASLPFEIDRFLLDAGDSQLCLREFPNRLISFMRHDDSSAWALYAFLVRRLRLADQGAMAWSA